MNLNEQQTQQAVEQLEQAWSSAEMASDAEALDQLLAEDFVCVGPVGFVLNREQYLASRRTGELQHTEFDWTDVNHRLHDDTVLAVGTQRKRSTYQGNDASGQFRVTQVAIRDGDAWQIASLHYSPIMQSPGR